jgi:hypothetical protein
MADSQRARTGRARARTRMARTAMPRAQSTWSARTGRARVMRANASGSAMLYSVNELHTAQGGTAKRAIGSTVHGGEREHEARAVWNCSSTDETG